MKAKNEMQLVFPAKTDNISFARATVAAFIGQLDPILAELDDITTAVSEAVTNAIVHGYENKEGTVQICVRLFSDNKVEIIVEDQGRGISDLQTAKQFGKTTQPEERIGIGFNLMEQCMDEVSIETTPTRETRTSPAPTSFIKYLCKKMGLVGKSDLSNEKKGFGTKVVMRKYISKSLD